jgi:hypothetical protein
MNRALRGRRIIRKGGINRIGLGDIMELEW